MFRNVIIRILFSPFALVYGIIVAIVNWFYDIDFLKASKFNLPVIGVGNFLTQKWVYKSIGNYEGQNPQKVRVPLQKRVKYPENRNNH